MISHKKQPSASDKADAKERGSEKSQLQAAPNLTHNPLYSQMIMPKMDYSSAKTEHKNQSSLLQQVTSSPDAGRPLPKQIRNQIEPVLGNSLSDVRVHDDPQSQLAAQDINAKAFTHKNHIHLGKNQSANDLQLMAHEATHVVQQKHMSHAPVQRNFYYHGSANVSPEARQRNRENRQRQDAARLETADSAWDISDIQYFDSVSPERRMELVRIILDQIWVGPFDEMSLARIWNSFGDGLAAQVNENETNTALWRNSINRGMDPSNILALRSLRTAFEDDVKELAKQYMRSNLEFCLSEQSRLGLRTGHEEQGPVAELSQELRLAETQELARIAEAALESQDQLREKIVGYQQHSPGMSASTYYSPVTFDPNARFSGTTSYQSNFAMERHHAPYSWNEVNADWQRLNAVLAGITAQSPAVFAALAQGRENLQALSKEEDPQTALATASRVLSTLEQNIRATIPKIDSGDLDWRDLQPIHQQLYSGSMTAPSSTNWNTEFTKSVARDVIGDHQSTQFWISLGLGSAAAALFVVASLASGGLATAALLGGVALSGAQAGLSWENYEDLATAAQSAATEETAIVSQGQADSAYFQAILDSVFLGMDLVPAGRALRATYQLAQEVSQRSAQTALRSVSEGGEAAALAIQRGITELGVRETMEQTGKSIDELSAILRNELSDEIAEPLIRRMEDARYLEGATGNLGRRGTVQSVGNARENGWAASRSIEQALGDITRALDGGIITRQFADRLVVEAIERIGPSATLQRAGGWTVLVRALTNNSAAGAVLMEWRQALFRDLEQFISEVVGGDIRRTGTMTKFSNDMDMSLVGANATEARQQAMAYLSRRLGCENSPKALNRILTADLFTDPTRIHIYDQLPLELRSEMAQRQAVIQEQMIWNRRLHEAVRHNDDQLENTIRQMMDDHQIAVYDYRPLSAGEIQRLSRQMDNWHRALDAAVASGNLAEQSRLAGRMTEGQAMINAAEDGGYFSSGGVRRWVSERPGEESFSRPGGLTEVGTHIPLGERLTAMVDQLPKLDEGRFLIDVEDSASIVGSMRSIGKYGERLLLMGTEMPDMFLPLDWNRIISECSQLKEAAELGGIATRISDEGAEAVVRSAFEKLDELAELSNTILEQMRAAARLPNVENGARYVQQMMRAHLRLLHAIETVKGHYNVILRAIKEAIPLRELLQNETTESTNSEPVIHPDTCEPVNATPTDELSNPNIQH